MLTLDQIYQAAYVLKDAARKTDLIYAPKFTDEFRPGREIYLKSENLQLTGSFKLRGAYFKIRKLNDEDKAAPSERWICGGITRSWGRPAPENPHCWHL